MSKKNLFDSKVFLAASLLMLPGLTSVAYSETSLHDNEWYMSQADDNATIQLSGHETEEAAIAFIKINNLSGDVGYYVTSYKNKPWYAVTSGVYSSVDEARKNLGQLPEEIRQHSPWPRSFKAIKELILAARDEQPGDASTASPATSEKQESGETISWEEGQVAYDKGDFERAFKIWQSLAGQGDSLSQFNLGVMYSRGEGTEADSDKAVEWYLLSAKQGYAPAQFNLGAAYLEGKLVAASPEKAVAWWQLAAEQGFVQAQFNLASLYCRGIGVAKDMAQCKFWYNRAASNGDIHARKMLDHLNQLEAASASPQATENAPASETASTQEEQLTAVAEQSFAEEEQQDEKLDSMPAQRKTTADEQVQLRKAQAAFTRNNYVKSYDLWLPLAQAGIAEAQYSLGFLYQSGWGPDQDFVQSVAWYTSAAEQGESRAQFNLGIILLNGEEGVEQDIEQGMLWLTRSAENNNTRARAFLADVYRTGKYGIEVSREKAEYWKSR